MPLITTPYSLTSNPYSLTTNLYSLITNPYSLITNLYPLTKTMMITTKGRNALKVMLDLAQHDDGNPVSLTDIAERVHESQKYLESTVSQLSQKGLIHSSRGKSGGYRLTRKPEDYTVAEIITAAEGSLAPVSCLTPERPCENADKCLSLPLWRELDEVIMNFLNSKSLADLLK